MTAIIRSTGMKGYRELMTTLGVDPMPLLRKHKLPADLGDVDDATVPILSVMQLMEDSAAAAHRPDLGLQLAARQDIDILGPLAMAIQHSANVREAMTTASRYLYVHSPAAQLSVIEPSTLVQDAAEIRLELVVPRAPVCRQALDQCLGRMHHLVRSFAADNYRLLAVAFPYGNSADPGAYARFFGQARIYTEQEHAGLHVSPQTLGSRLENVNASLKNIALEYLQRHYGDPGLSMVERVRRALHCTLGATGGSKSAIAELLFVHPRTMQRKLADEGATFEGVRDEVRQEIALRYLQQTTIPLAQLTSLLGFSDQSVLTQSSIRWFGMPPSKIRASSRPRAPAAANRSS
ncbi:AraC family transcriptional regulator [Burkholderia lata]|uniref:Transcriptional regulator, AraC family n=1 Tax=Burkholderia lata (strain ATCC 17760 / DSM 23089 / LMG 22485 / NCIMB 9086 / R18194 / 383) TaxID=482957 RepID=Q397P9_BURL3|nr:AraC family transcriptional regulator [Burkholderia lata]ABB11312.1 transcriptional regulator, AraC family [Burkholderia lata]